MEYRFSLTPRLMALGAFSILALLVLLFALGYLLGRRTAEVDAAPAAAETASAAVPAAAETASAAAPAPTPAPAEKAAP